LKLKLGSSKFLKKEKNEKRKKKIQPWDANFIDTSIRIISS